MIQLTKEDSQFNPEMIIGPVEHRVYICYKYDINIELLTTICVYILLLPH